jgi:DNA modification methylase
MQEVAWEEYWEFVKQHKSVIIEDVEVKLKAGKWEINSYAPPKDYKPERDTVWSFPDRGDWATHKGDYRGNWSPYIPRNLILRYTEPGDWVLDQMCGSGTTLVECKLLGRNAMGVDINPDAIMVTLDRLNFHYKPLDESWKEPTIKVYVGDARNLDKIKDESVDLIATHPPYASIIPYSKGKVQGDISALPLPEYLKGMHKIAEECWRVLKPGKHCSILIGDTRHGKHYIPIAFRVMQTFLDVGFILKEDIIKQQWRMKTTREVWLKGQRDFYLIAHEHLFVFRKPERGEKLSNYRYSMKWG